MPVLSSQISDPSLDKLFGAKTKVRLLNIIASIRHNSLAFEHARMYFSYLHANHAFRGVIQQGFITNALEIVVILVP